MYLHSHVAHLSVSVCVAKAEKLLGSKTLLANHVCFSAPSSLMSDKRQAVSDMGNILILVSMLANAPTVNQLQPIKRHTNLTHTWT